MGYSDFCCLYVHRFELLSVTALLDGVRGNLNNNIRIKFHIMEDITAYITI